MMFVYFKWFFSYEGLTETGARIMGYQTLKINCFISTDEMLSFATKKIIELEKIRGVEVQKVLPIFFKRMGFCLKDTIDSF